MRVLIVGCGYVGLPLAVEMARRGHQTCGLRRSTVSNDALVAAGVKPLHADISDISSLKQIPAEFDWIVNCVASGGGGAEEYRNLYLRGMTNLVEWLTARGANRPRILYTSSTGVYGQNDGSLVDESSPTEPATETGKILVETENVLLESAKQKNFPAFVLRAAGIYGPERGYLLKQFLRGEARIEGDGSRILNMIHRDDLIRAIIATLEGGRAGEIYNASDDEPVTQRDFFAWLAATLKHPLPPVVEEAEMISRRRGLTSKRISNAKLKGQLAFTFRFPNYRAGYLNEIQRLGLLPG